MFFTPLKSRKDDEKLMRLYYEYRKIMYKEAYTYLQDRSLTEDALQETFEKVIKNLHKIDENDAPRTRSYLVVISRNTAMDMLKKKPSSNDTYFDEYISSEDTGSISDALDIVINRETAGELMKAIETLPEIYRDVFIMRRVEGYSRKEIAELLNISVETVKKRLTRAKHKIIEYMKGSE